MGKAFHYRFSRKPGYAWSFKGTLWLLASHSRDYVGIPLMIITALTQAAAVLNLIRLMNSTNKINPVSGLKRIFSLKGLVELGKAVLKVLLFSIGALVILKLVPDHLSISVSRSEPWPCRGVGFPISSGLY